MHKDPDSIIPIMVRFVDRWNRFPMSIAINKSKTIKVNPKGVQALRGPKSPKVAIKGKKVNNHVEIRNNNNDKKNIDLFLEI